MHDGAMNNSSAVCSLLILRCFIAGADLGELAHISTADAYRREYLKDLSDAVASMRKPIVAAVVGLAVSHIVVGSTLPLATGRKAVREEADPDIGHISARRRV
jgi:type II secretory pathway component PulF